MREKTGKVSEADVRRVAAKKGKIALGLFSLNHFGVRATLPGTQCIGPHVTADTRPNILAVFIAQRSYQCITSLLTDFATLISVTAIQSTGSLVHLIKTTQNSIDPSLVAFTLVLKPI